MYGDPPTCKYCGLPISFITTKAGKSAPVDGFSFWVVPKDTGEVFFTEDGGTVRGDPVDMKGPATVKAWKNHIITCPVRNKGRARKTESWNEMLERQVRERIEKERAEAAAKAARKAERERREAAEREAADAQYSLFGT